jgi:hypothetical protein
MRQESQVLPATFIRYCRFNVLSNRDPFAPLLLGSQGVFRLRHDLPSLLPLRYGRCFRPTLFALDNKAILFSFHTSSLRNSCLTCYTFGVSDHSPPSLVHQQPIPVPGCRNKGTRCCKLFDTCSLWLFPFAAASRPSRSRTWRRNCSLHSLRCVGTRAFVLYSCLQRTVRITTPSTETCTENKYTLPNCCMPNGRFPSTRGGQAPAAAQFRRITSHKTELRFIVLHVQTIVQPT